MFRTVPMSIIRSFSLYIKLYIQVMLTASEQDVSKPVMTYTIAVCTVKNS